MVPNRNVQQRLGEVWSVSMRQEHTVWALPSRRADVLNPDKHITVSLASYERAHQENDAEALGKITRAGIPLGCTFGGAISLTTAKEYADG